jgi:hypothetical protein
MGGSVPTGLLAHDLALPWTKGDCTQWSRNPPEFNYAPPIQTSEGLWALGGGYLMRRGPSGWRMDATPDDFAPSTTPLGIVGDDTMLALLGGGATVTDVYTRTNGMWAHAPSAGAPLSAMAIVSGSSLLVLGKDPGAVHRYDGAWTALPLGTWATPNALWGSPNDLYVAHTKGLQHFDGNAWTELVPAFPVIEIVGVGGTSPTDVYAVSKTTAYHVDSGALTPLSAPVSTLPPCNSSPPSFTGILSSSARVVLLDKCQFNTNVARLWERDSGGWTLLPALPAAVVSTSFYVTTRYRMMPDGTISLSRIDNASDTGMYLSNGASWDLVPIETLEPVRGEVRAHGGNPVYATSEPVFGLSRLVGNAFQPVAGIPSTITAAGRSPTWRAPDGTLFIAARSASDTTELWRYDGSAFTLDHTQALDPVVLTGRSSSDVILLDKKGAFLRWNGASWVPGPSAPLPSNHAISGGACAGTNRIVAGHVDQTSQTSVNLLEYDGASWADIGASPGTCCTQLGTTTPSAAIMLDASMLAVRDQAGWSMVPMAVPANQTLLSFAGPSVNQLFGRLLNTSNSGFALATLDAAHMWTTLIADDRFLSAFGTAGSLWTDGQKAAMPSTLGGHVVGAGLGGGEAITVCNLAP